MVLKIRKHLETAYQNDIVFQCDFDHHWFWFQLKTNNICQYHTGNIHSSWTRDCSHCSHRSKLAVGSVGNGVHPMSIRKEKHMKAMQKALQIQKPRLIQYKRVEKHQCRETSWCRCIAGCHTFLAFRVLLSFFFQLLPGTWEGFSASTGFPGGCTQDGYAVQIIPKINYKPGIYIYTYILIRYHRWYIYIVAGILNKLMIRGAPPCVSLCNLF